MSKDPELIEFEANSAKRINDIYYMWLRDQTDKVIPEKIKRMKTRRTRIRAANRFLDAGHYGVQQVDDPKDGEVVYHFIKYHAGDGMERRIISTLKIKFTSDGTDNKSKQTS